jgi:IclR family pca regulon transcriptional regulator
MTQARDFVHALDRGLAVIRAFDATNKELTLSAVARATGVNRASVRRFLRTLVELGYVSTDGRLFALRPKILELGYTYLSTTSLPEVAVPHLERLVGRIHESSLMSVLEDGEVLCVARVPARRILRIAVPIGTRFPAYATAMGRVLLAGQSDDRVEAYAAATALTNATATTLADVEMLRAELDRVRCAGYAVVDHDLEDGLHSLAAPVRDRDGRVAAAVNVSAHASRGSVARLRDAMLGPLLETAAAIEQDFPRVDHRD